MIKTKFLVSTYYVGPTGIKNTKKVQQLLKQQIIRNSGKKRGVDIRVLQSGKTRKNLSKLLLDSVILLQKGHALSHIMPRRYSKKLSFVSVRILKFGTLIKMGQEPMTIQNFLFRNCLVDVYVIYLQVISMCSYAA